jgi:hypothetical protein
MTWLGEVSAVEVAAAVSEVVVGAAMVVWIVVGAASEALVATELMVVGAASDAEDDSAMVVTGKTEVESTSRLKEDEDVKDV